jgi:hypothetical protein
MSDLFATPFSPINAHATLRDVQMNLPNFNVQGKSPSRSYAMWAATTRVRLKGTLTRSAIESLFAGSLHQAALMDVPSELVHCNAAATDLCARVGEIADELKSVMDQAGLSSSLPLVLDTNLILEYEPVQSIDWTAFAGEPVRLIIPLRVFEELEEARYSNSKNKSQIARDELPRLVAMVEASPKQPAVIPGRDDTTIELFDLRHDGLRPSWADDEILDFFGTMQQFLPSARLITDDGPLLVRARYRGYGAERGPERRRRH